MYVEPFEWDVEGRAFTVLAGEELYVVHRTGNDLTVTFADRADDEIYRASVCAGGEYVVYATWNDSVVLLPADGTSGERREWESAEYDVSADGKHLAITSADEFGEHTLELLPCGEGTSTRLIEGYESSLEAYFMGRGPYLLVEELGSPVGYFDIRAPTSLQLFSRAIFVDTWSEDGSYAVLVVGTGSDLLRFDLATGETEPIATSSGGRRYLGDLLVLEPSSEEEDGTVVSIIDPRTPASPILELEPSEGASVEQIRRDPSGARIAYLESGPEGTSVHIVELATQARITYALPGALDYDLDDFSGDGAGVLVSVGRPRFRLYWLAATADAEAAEPRLVHEAAWGDIYYGQPWQP
nr:MAG: hypothetical protein DIU78_02305 [Pseudomonadota bacterium]